MGITMRDYMAKHGPWAELYTHVAKDGRNIHIAVAPLRQAAQRHLRPELIPIDPKVAETIIDTSADPRRLGELVETLVKSGKKHLPGHDPIIAAIDHDGKWLLVDGTHRYIVASLLGMKKIRAYVCYPAMWEQFRLSDAPDMTAEQLAASPHPSRFKRPST